VRIAEQAALEIGADGTGRRRVEGKGREVRVLKTTLEPRQAVSGDRRYIDEDLGDHHEDHRQKQQTRRKAGPKARMLHTNARLVPCPP